MNLIGFDKNRMDFLLKVDFINKTGVLIELACALIKGFI